MTVRVRHGIDDLQRDLAATSKRVAVETAKAVRDNAKDGNRRAKALAKVSAGKHGKHYHKAFTAEPVDAFTWVYGPDSSKKQGDMSFEYGSRNQPPHLDLNKSADVISVTLLRDVRAAHDRLLS